MSAAACRRFVLTLAFVGSALLAAASEPPDADLDRSKRSLELAAVAYDVASAESALAQIGKLDSTRSTARRLQLRVRAELVVAELLRIEFEELEPGQREARATLGSRIDALATAALARIEELPESSERWRMRADLIATQIRSDFRARKHGREFENASRKALELDQTNPAAWVTAAKPFVFAGPAHGQDYGEAIRLLDRALELSPGLESALLLRGLAEERNGAPERALQDWRAALQANPKCAPARAAIARASAGTAAD